MVEPPRDAVKSVSVYVATKLENIEKARECVAKFKEKGIEIQYDWTEHGSLQAVSAEKRAGFAAKEVEGARTCDILVAILPGGRGTHCEIGVALGLKKPVILVVEDEGFIEGAEGYFCLFYYHPLVRWVRSIEQAVEVAGAL